MVSHASIGINFFFIYDYYSNRAAIKGNLECLYYFSDFLDMHDNIGLTPVFWSYLYDHKDCINYFISRKVLINNSLSDNGKFCKYLLINYYDY